MDVHFEACFFNRRWALLALAAMVFMLRPAIADTTLTILTHYTDAQRVPLTDCLREYERQHPGIRIIHQQAEIEDYLQSVVTARLSGTSPDIYNIYSVWSARLVASGMLDRPPTDIMRLIDAAYVPTTVTAIRVGGEVWGIPSEVSTFMLIYNKKLFRDAGIADPPRDWDELVADAARMTKRNSLGKMTTAGFAFGPTIGGSVYPFVALLLSHGIEPIHIKPNGTNLLSDGAIEVLSDEASLFSEGMTDTTIQVRDFSSGAVGMMIFANWYKDTLRQAFGAAMDATVGVAPIPAGQGWKTLQYAFFWGVDAHSPHKTEAWDLLAWLNTPHGANQQSCTGAMLGHLGALTGNRNDIAAGPQDYGDPFSKPFADAIASGRAGSLPNIVDGVEIQDILRLMIGRAWTGTLTPQAALRSADRQITAILNESN